MVLKFVLVGLKFLLTCIAYIQEELNISFIYRFMMGVVYKVELDLFSLCGTRVWGELNISIYTLYIMLIWVKGLVIPSPHNTCMQGELT